MWFGACACSRAAYSRARRPSPAYCAAPLCLEELQMGPGARFHGTGSRRLLGERGLPYVWRPFSRAALPGIRRVNALAARCARGRIAIVGAARERFLLNVSPILPA